MDTKKMLANLLETLEVATREPMQAEVELLAAARVSEAVSFAEKNKTSFTEAVLLIDNARRELRGTARDNALRTAVLGAVQSMEIETSGAALALDGFMPTETPVATDDEVGAAARRLADARSALVGAGFADPKVEDVREVLSDAQSLAWRRARKEAEAAARDAAVKAEVERRQAALHSVPRGPMPPAPDDPTGLGPTSDGTPLDGAGGGS